MSGRGYQPREYRVVKLILPGTLTAFLVVSVDLEDPDVWTVINRCATAAQGWEYVREVEARNRALIAGLVNA